MPEDITWVVDKALADGLTMTEFIESRFALKPHPLPSASPEDIRRYQQASHRRLNHAGVYGMGQHATSVGVLEAGGDGEQWRGETVEDVAQDEDKLRDQTVPQNSNMTEEELLYVQEGLQIPGLEIVQIFEGSSRRRRGPGSAARSSTSMRRGSLWSNLSDWTTGSCKTLVREGEEYAPDPLLRSDVPKSCRERALASGRSISDVLGQLKMRLVKCVRGRLSLPNSLGRA